MTTHHILWRFDVSYANRLNFEAAYGPFGPWTALFSEYEGYLGTDLVKTGPTTYITIDKWASEAAYQQFRWSAERDYTLLCASCRPLSLSQTFLGEGTITDIAA